MDGNAYQRPIVVKEGAVKEIQVFSPKNVMVEKDGNNIATGYKVKIGGATKRFKISNVDESSEIKHLKNFNPLDEYEGVSVLSSAKTVVDILNSGDTHNLNTFTNQARPSGALSYDPKDGGSMSDEQFDRLKEEIREQYSGTQNSGKPLLLEGGLKWVQMSLSAKDLDYINSRGISQKDIARAFKVPAVLLGLDNDSTYNNVREARLGLWDDAIIPTLRKVVNHWNKHILPLFANSEGLELAIDLTGISDLETRTERQWKRIDNADFVTINEKRNMIGLDPIEGGDTIMISSGDIPMSLLNQGVTASNLNELVQAGTTAPEPTEEPVKKKDFEFVESKSILETIEKLTVTLEDGMMKDVTPLLRKYGEQAEKFILENGELGASFAVLNFSNELANVMRPHLEKTINIFGESVLKRMSEKGDGSFLYKNEPASEAIAMDETTRILIASEWTRRVAKYVEEEALLRAKLIESSSREAIRTIMVEGINSGKTFVDMAKEANEVLGDKVRARTIVATEIHGAREYGSYEASKATGLKIEKTWMTSGDERVRSPHVRANKQTVPLKDKFIVGGERLDHPGDHSASPQNRINCRCTVLYNPVE